MGKANPHRGEVCLALGGRDYKLVPSYANLAAIEAGCGVGLIQFTRNLTTKGYNLTSLARIVSEAAEPEITLEDAGAAIIKGGIVTVAEAVTRFLTQALLGGEEGNVPAAKGK